MFERLIGRYLQVKFEIIKFLYTRANNTILQDKPGEKSPVTYALWDPKDKKRIKYAFFELDGDRIFSVHDITGATMMHKIIFQDEGQVEYTSFDQKGDEKISCMYKKDAFGLRFFKRNLNKNNETQHYCFKQIIMEPGKITESILSPRQNKLHETVITDIRSQDITFEEKEENGSIVSIPVKLIERNYPFYFKKQYDFLADKIVSFRHFLFLHFGEHILDNSSIHFFEDRLTGYKSEKHYNENNLLTRKIVHMPKELFSLPIIGKILRNSYFPSLYMDISYDKKGNELYRNGKDINNRKYFSKMIGNNRVVFFLNNNIITDVAFFDEKFKKQVPPKKLTCTLPELNINNLEVSLDGSHIQKIITSYMDGEKRTDNFNSLGIRTDFEGFLSDHNCTYTGTCYPNGNSREVIYKDHGIERQRDRYRENGSLLTTFEVQEGGLHIDTEYNEFSQPQKRVLYYYHGGCVTTIFYENGEPFSFKEEHASGVIVEGYYYPNQVVSNQVTTYPNGTFKKQKFSKEGKEVSSVMYGPVGNYATTPKEDVKPQKERVSVRRNVPFVKKRKSGRGSRS